MSYTSGNFETIYMEQLQIFYSKSAAFEEKIFES